MMQKWEYAHAIYKDGQLDPHIKEGLAHINNGSVSQFLYEAGQNGWELCAALPYPTIKEPDGTLAVIFKRPIAEQQEQKHAPEEEMGRGSGGTIAA